MGKSKSNTNAKNKSRAKPKSKGLANNTNNNNTKPSKSSSQSNKASASAGRNSNSNTKQQQVKSNKKSSSDKNCNAKNNKMTSSTIVTADRPSSSPSSGRDGIIVPPRAKATSTTTVTSTNLVAGSMEGKQIEEPPSPSSTIRGYDEDRRGCPKANRVHTLVHRIGKGRFSEVYSCASKASASIDGIGMGPYAIKIVSKNKKRKAHKNGEEGGDVEMAQEEVRIHRRLVHENIVRCPHAFTDDTSTYLILELCHNESIQHMLHRRESSRLTEPEAKYYLKQLVGALKYLHDERYVAHRDVNPATLLLDKNMQLKLSGFGLARELQATQTNGRSASIAKGSGGSPAFMAPESIKTKAGRTTCHTPSFEVDVWSVGAVCFNTLVGKSPFATNDAEVTYQRILDNDYDFPDNIDVSEDARDLIGRLLRTDPSDRLSLDEIDLHPFLACDPGQIPKSIPQSATHGRPEWRISKKGLIYAANNASKSPHCVPNISKDTGELQSHPLESFPQPTSEEEPIEPEEVNVDEEENNASSNNLTPEGQARAAFFAEERAHQQLYTKAMIEWGVAEYARRQTQKQRRANNDQFSRAFVDPEEIKEDSRFMNLLTKKCEQAYKSLYGHRTGGTVKIVDNVDPNVLGKHGKIIAVDEDPNDPEKISFKIEIQEKRVDGTIAYATALPSDIEMRNKGDGGTPKKNGKRGKGKKKKGGKNSSTAKSGSPSEYVINLKPIYDVNVTVTKSDLDTMTSDSSGMIYVLDDMMAKRNEEEGRMEVELQRSLEESKKADLEALEKEELLHFSDTLKMLTKMARRIRSAQNVERVPLSERIELDKLQGRLFGASEKGMSDRIASMLKDHAELVLDSLTDVFDVFDSFEKGSMDRSLFRLYKLLAPKRELMMILNVLGHPEETTALSIFLELFVLHTCAMIDGDRVFLLFEDFAFASVDASDPRLAFIKMNVFRDIDHENFEEESEEDLSCYAELLGVSADADAKTIMKAFRKQSMQCHPDKAESNGLTAEQAEEKFKALSAAKTALLASTEESEEGTLHSC